MKLRVAVECFADLDLLEFLRDHCDLPNLVDHHAYSQGEVVKAVFEKGRADVGIVDEDPNRSHHSLRDRMKIIRTGVDVDVHELGGRRLLVVKPELEKSFVRAMSRIKQESHFKTSSEMHRVLSSQTSRQHDRFKAELMHLRDAYASKKIKNLVSELADALREVVS
ncbi:MAG TPA: hypothetical protein VGK52_01760 [Polyangia bacterium]